MGTLADYFRENRYKPKYWIGDRVFGYWNKIPFIGTVGNDTVINDLEGPRVSVFLDLPIKYQGMVKHIVIVKPKDLKLLVDY